MTGIATLTGRLSAAVGTTLAAEKTRLPYSGSPPDASIMPLFGSRTTDIAPDDGEPGVEPILHRFAVPAISRIASPCQLPASLPVPPVHARKGGGQMEKTHNTEGLGSENISMFFSNSIVNRKGFLPRPALFRAWTGGGDREAGSWQSDALQSHEHDIPTYAGISGTRATLIDDKGNLNQSNITLDVGRFYTYPTGPSGRIAAESRPVNISVPAILYLGLPA